MFRSLHTSAVAHGKRLSNRRAELAAQRAAAAEAKQRAVEQLRALKDTQFLNSLAQPEQLFASTQITQQDKAADSTQASPSPTRAAALSGDDKGSIRRTADSGRYACQVSPDEMQLVTDVAPRAAVGVDSEFGVSFLPETAIGNPRVQADIVRRVVALENSNAKGVTHYNIARAIQTFGRRTGDSGSPEVQAAVWTVRINQLEAHLRTHRKDHHNRRAYTMLLHRRAKMLKYLRRESLERYYVCLKQLGLTRAMVEGEIIQPKRIE
ncbi:hypothetical protein GGF46_002613 [Coemansia sp. RSA 552]|nr:hypothetical protein GGF46_002613 [Coemansia sp. RSA 552]